MCARIAARCAGAAVLIAQVGCGTTIEGRFDPALFPRGAVAESPFHGRIAVLADPAALAMTVIGERISDMPASPVQVPIGRIVHEASLAAFGATFRGGARAVDRLPFQDPSPAAIVSVRVAQYVYRDRLQYFIPLGPLAIERWQLDVQLAAELRVLDAGGAILWSAAYDSGVQIYEPPPFSVTVPRERRADALARLTHESAYRLMQQAARDVGEWLRNEQLRQRSL